MVVQRNAIPECKLCKTFFIELVQKFSGIFIEREIFANECLRYVGFIVTHPGSQKYQTKNSIEHLSLRRRELTCRKIENQRFLETWSLPEPIPERQGRDRRIVMITLEYELLILHTRPQRPHGSRVIYRGERQYRDCLRSSCATATHHRPPAHDRRSPGGSLCRAPHRGRRAASRANPRAGRRARRGGRTLPSSRLRRRSDAAPG